MNKQYIIQNNTKKFRRVNEAGFTLIELMVSLSIFIIVVLASISSLYSVNNAAKKVEGMRNVLDNLNFAIESMSRTIRTGSNLSCSSVPNSNCPLNTTGSGSIALSSTLGFTTSQNIAYTFNQTNGSIEKVVGGNTIPITSPEIQVTRVRFYVDGANPADGKQPGVAIFIEGIAKAGLQNTAPFAIQTYISQRAVE